jgi:hypothetical protein
MFLFLAIANDFLQSTSQPVKGFVPPFHIFKRIWAIPYLGHLRYAIPLTTRAAYLPFLLYIYFLLGVSLMVNVLNM